MQPTYPLKETLTRSREKKLAQAVSPITFVWSDSLEQWEGHANSLHPERLVRAYTLLQKVGALDSPSLQLIPPNERWSRFDALLDFHHPDYCKSLLQWYEMNDLCSAERFGFSETETIPFLDMAEIAQHYVSATRTAVRFAATSVQTPTKVVCLAGEQVHACPEKVKSGDILNDVALALLDANRLVKKVAFINLDAEHPTIIQDLFFKDSNIMTISLHEDPFFLYPGTGKVSEIGEGKGRGYNINIPLPPKAGDRQIKLAFKQVIGLLLKQFAPNLVIMLGGPSAHVSESLAHLRLTTHGYQKIVTNLAALAPRFVLLGGSGSDWDVSARLWTLAVGTLTGQVHARNNSASSSDMNEDSTTILSPFEDEALDSSTRMNMLHDEAITALPHSMQTYLEHTFQSTLLQAQQHLFPLWNLPISIDEQLVLKNIKSLYGVTTIEKKIGNQTDLTEKRSSLNSRLATRDENDELKQHKSSSKLSIGSLSKPSLNELRGKQIESARSSIEKEPKLRKERKEIAPDLDSVDQNRVASGKERTYPAKNDKKQSQDSSSSKRKRSRRRRRRSGGK